MIFLLYYLLLCFYLWPVILAATLVSVVGGLMAQRRMPIVAGCLVFGEASFLLAFGVFVTAAYGKPLEGFAIGLFVAPFFLPHFLVVGLITWGVAACFSGIGRLARGAQPV